MGYIFNSLSRFEGNSSFKNGLKRAKNSFLRAFGLEDKIVIGENMGMVMDHADNIGADYYGGLGRSGTEGEYLVDNIAFINEKMDQGYTIIDIGPSPNYDNYPNITSIYYATEITHIANRNGPMIPYEHYKIDESSFARWKN